MQVGIYLPHIGRKAGPEAYPAGGDPGRGAGLRRCLDERAHHSEGRALPAFGVVL